MTAIRIDRFTGMAPKLSNRLLPDSAGSSVQNARLMSGELRGIREPSLVHTFATGTVRNVRRVYKDDGTAVWIALENFDSDIAKGPLIDDGFDRYYWTGEEDFVAYNSLARIEVGDPPFRLGTPAPTTAASIVVTGGSSSQETRSYTYTFINSWGEESAPAPVVVESGPVDGSWDLSSLATTVPDSTNRQTVTHKRIYRTVTGLATVSYFFVAEIALASATYSDTSTNAEVALNNELLSFDWAVPPDDLRGLIAHPNGFLVGFVGKELFFSERYRPHAWPVKFIHPVEHPIVGLAIYNNMIAVMTEGNPYFASGNRPENITTHKNESVEPCLSKRSIASTLSGVLYASPNGLVLLDERAATVVTNPIISVEEWSRYTPTALKAAQYSEQYLAYYSPARGIKFSPSEPFGIFVEIDKFDDVDNVLTDHTTGECWLLRGNSVYRWEPPSGIPLHYTWVSKEFDFTRPVNFGAYMVKSEAEPIEFTEAQLALLTAFNEQRITGPLNPLNYTPLGGKATATFDVGTSPAGIDEIVQNKYPLGGSPLFSLAAQEGQTTSVALRVFADGRLVYQKTPSSLRTYRLPAGFKAHVWQFELVGNSNVYSLAVAETAKELASV